MDDNDNDIYDEMCFSLDNDGDASKGEMSDNKKEI